MAKKKTERPARFISKQQLSTREKHKKRQRLISAIGLLVIVAVVALVGVGWFVSEYQPMHEVVIRVNDTAFNMQYYIDMLALRAQAQSPEYLSFLTNIVVNDIERGEIIRQGAQELGFTVSNDEVSAELKKNKLPTNRVHWDVMRTQLIMKKMLAEYFDPKVPTTAHQRQLMAMFLESETVARAVRNRVMLGEDFSELAAQQSLHEEAKANKGDFGWHPKEIFTGFIGIKTAAEWGFAAEVGDLSLPLHDADTNKPFGYWILRVLERDVDNEGDAHVQAILVGSLEEADQVRARLVQGEDFATVAKEVSQLKDAKQNGGDLGPIAPGKVTAAFDKFAFDTTIPLNTLSSPIKDEESTTRIGYWLVKVVAKADNRKITEEDRNLLKAKQFDDWVSETLLDPANKIDHDNLDAAKKNQAVLEILGRKK